ncbi:MAG: hypothetical protein JRG96_08420 [Deltaproteobacteria bacterium]|nr:hypothetical protein [Deltaproteobacteria bacterium]MBW2420678.1 hypothetical protein [Deltaproteobacteria bacterium]
MPELLRANLETILADEEKLMKRIYEDLFEEHPHAAEVFSEYSEAGQRQMVRETLMYSIDHLEAASWVKPNLVSLGQKHHAYEVTDEMYDWFVDCLIRVFAELSGPEWNEELETRWREVLDHISDLMRRAAPSS